MVVKGVASQTADLQEWQNSSGTSIAAVTAGGVLQSTVAVYTPTIQQIGGGGASLNFATTQVGLYGHLASVTAIVVGATAGAGLGTTPPALVVTGTTDTRGVITFGTGTVPSIGADVVVAFATAYTSTPVVTITEQNGLTKALNLYISAVSTGGFTISGLVAPAASQANTVYSVAYTVIG